ncbi:unnamed protein product (mitochondrion) [Plasmodiophora brassicae]|uniref:Dihydropteridine reductase n=1 Tax=Plasmodiophora brassicae TaxID=37360 RepID=A0A3P3Y3N2_PLABS|nr:unnamed protein product [Plasmodiophora brassicae]
MVSVQRALVVGGAGSLGGAVIRTFQKVGWHVTSADVRAGSGADVDIVLSKCHTPALHAEQILDGLPGVNAVVHVAGAWVGGAIHKKDVLKNAIAMFNINTASALVAAHVASHSLLPGNLLMLTGALPCLYPTPAMLAYGMSKNSIHYLVRCLVESELGVKVACILPQTLDTPSNREAMPKADTTTWTPVYHVAERIVDWAEDPRTVTQGAFYAVVTEKNRTIFNTVDPKDHF